MRRTILLLLVLVFTSTLTEALVSPPTTFLHSRSLVSSSSLPSSCKILLPPSSPLSFSPPAFLPPRLGAVPFSSSLVPASRRSSSLSSSRRSPTTPPPVVDDEYDDMENPNRKVTPKMMKKYLAVALVAFVLAHITITLFPVIREWYLEFDEFLDPIGDEDLME